MDTKMRNCRFLRKQKSSHVGRLSCNSKPFGGGMNVMISWRNCGNVCFQMEIYGNEFSGVVTYFHGHPTKNPSTPPHRAGILRS